MEQATKRSVEMLGMLEEYRSSGLRRREFCQSRGIALTTFAYWQKRVRSKTETPVEARPRLLQVKVAAVGSAVTGSFTVSLVNGRRIESSWSYAEAELARLIRVVESA